jgi:hypothetical protein
MPCQIILKWSRQMTKFTSNKQEHQTKQKQEGKQKLDLLSLEQGLDTSECFSSKNFKQPTRIAPCSMLDRFVQWSRHLEKNHTKLTNASSNNFKGLKFLLLSS